MMNIAVFASGNGSNFQALLDASHNGLLNATIKLLVCDRPGAFAVERARKAGVETFVFSPKEFSSKEEYEAILAKKLKDLQIEWIALAGYMRLIGTVLLSSYEGRIVNIHPSLLPLYPGKDAVGQALADGACNTGVTVHFVDEGMDTGPIIEQIEISIAEQETTESLQAKIQKVEHRLYPTVLQSLVTTQGGGHYGKKTGTD
ncbi:phosphoribosylglycinamide formyltransferase [Bacillus sp. FJAT-27225]|uniref:phosphoribosylglycinamide formyltransferase n=1 Tax=Bacillus sp. FJAT-27225 TaxID=1743144 RepID=UPI00080C3167|nr:phosphoribosylglycinamide formyltransferase [Bacillus sp. FJAT-27225]OCA88594.1 phosphoribosylglycinamide formyltransferase [Bacillus sp. FJAT-27225]